MKVAPRVLFISHDAWRAGAQIVLLHFLRWLKVHTQIPFEIILKDGIGPLRPEFEALASVAVWNDTASTSGMLAQLIDSLGLRTRLGDRRSRIKLDHVKAHLRQANIGLIYSNTITNGHVLAALSSLNCPVITHVHELEYWIAHRVDPVNLTHVRAHTRHYIAASQAVKQTLMNTLQIPESGIDVIHEFIPMEPPSTRHSQAAKIRTHLNLPQEARLVGACGTTDWRKGPDLFIQLACAVRRRQPDLPAHFVWVGGETAGPEFAALWHDVTRTGLEGYVHFLGERPNPLDYFAAFDVFALVSREDPFPLVALEAASLGKPIVCFDRAGGAKEFVEDDAGFVVPYLDVELMASRVLALLSSPDLGERLGQQAATKVQQRHDVSRVAPRILDVIERFLPASRQP
jgi:glycosyltransferase involved in cell wall biosynthesis